MAVRKEQRRGTTRLIVDIRYRDERTGKRSRYRRDAQVQTMAAARAENGRKLAELGAKGFLADPEPEEPAEGPVYTFGDAVKAFRETKAVAELKRTTLRGYNVSLDAYLLPRLKALPLADVGHGEAASLDAEMVKAKLRPSTRRNVIIALRSVLRSAVDDGHLPAMPPLPELPKVGAKVCRPPSPGEVDKVLNAATQAARLALLLAADAGLRAGEIRGLRWLDVDLAEGLLCVRQTVYLGEVDTPKSGHEREVPLSSRLAAALRHEKTWARPEPADHVSLSSRGTVWGESSLIHALHAALGRAGLPQARVHDLRHFFVTQCFRVGGDAPTVQTLAGHQHLSVTQLYAHTDADRKREVVRRLGDAGNGGATGQTARLTAAG